MKKYKLKIKLPKNSVFRGKVGDSLSNYTLFDVEENEVLERVIFKDISKVNFWVKDGQFIEKGTIVFTEGFLGYKAYVSEFSGIVDIGYNYYQLIGQRLNYRKKVNLNGRVIRCKDSEFLILSLMSNKIVPGFYMNKKNIISPKIYLNEFNKDFIKERFSFFRFIDATCFLNANIHLEHLRFLVLNGVKRLIVNGLFVDDIIEFYNLISKLDGLAVLGGFSEIIPLKYEINFNSKYNYDVLWRKKYLLISDELNHYSHNIAFEHPFWGITGTIKIRDSFRSTLNRNGDIFEIYKKNILLSKL